MDLDTVTRHWRNATDRIGRHRDEHEYWSEQVRFSTSSEDRGHSEAMRGIAADAWSRALGARAALGELLAELDPDNATDKATCPIPAAHQPYQCYFCLDRSEARTE